jgi:hypothetical protein
VTEPFDAVTSVQGDASFGGILIHAPRARIREAVQACKAIRPLTRAAIVFASDDAVRSTDRIHVLEAGADDCLSGGIDFRELDLRIKQAIAAGSNPVVPSDDVQGARATKGDTNPLGGRFSSDDFAAELQRRAANPVLSFFCVLDVAAKGVPVAVLEELLAEHVRCDEGDMVAQNAKGCMVLLQGAREGQLGPFLARLRSRIGEQAVLDVLSHPAEAGRIRSLLGLADASEN